MEVFVDTSAVFALVEVADKHHTHARPIWLHLLDSDAVLRTTNYVVVECCALLQSRIGLEAVHTFVKEILPTVTVQWVSPDQHAAGLFALLAANRRKRVASGPHFFELPGPVSGCGTTDVTEPAANAASRVARFVPDQERISIGTRRVRGAGVLARGDGFR